MSASEADNSRNVRYVLDTSSLIGGIKELYCPEVFPDIWKNISDLIKQHRVYIPKAVSNEAKKKSDAVSEWLKNQLKIILQSTEKEEEQVEREIASLMRKYPSYPTKRSTADLAVIAWGKIFSAQVITQEHPNTASQIATNKIPSVCAGERIDCGSLYKMLDCEKMCFINK